jgi:competence protein ComEA
VQRPDAALALAGALWVVALAPAPPATTHCPESGSRPERCTAAATREPTSLLFGTPLDLNRAAPSSLEVLQGIGPARAAAIVAERCRAPFASVAELERVPGIGPRTRQRLADSVAAGPGPVAGCPNSSVRQTP